MFDNFLQHSRLSYSSNLFLARTFKVFKGSKIVISCLFIKIWLWKEAFQQQERNCFNSGGWTLQNSEQLLIQRDLNYQVGLAHAIACHTNYENTNSFFTCCLEFSYYSVRLLVYHYYRRLVILCPIKASLFSLPWLHQTRLNKEITFAAMPCIWIVSFISYVSMNQAFISFLLCQSFLCSFSYPLYKEISKCLVC